ncbi:hypothetical protein AZO1586R_1413 [Bathymodiolus azoricus thioautotrophic gill symbiont]|uniref:Uncharacterized protein n=1 Tax=Bathymodiolus azoricus thioautotrophic gill symbiont TaxID=235205 RepID=A0ACA8ZRH7_9GAMM|nr:hypothetical protein AZO1586R_1413 [Bathymodiolus azoricus thioautotrophic gill symbiont]
MFKQFSLVFLIFRRASSLLNKSTHGTKVLAQVNTGLNALILFNT